LLKRFLSQKKRPSGSAKREKHVNEETETLVGEAYPPPAAQKSLSDLILSKFITLINIASDED